MDFKWIKWVFLILKQRITLCDRLLGGCEQVGFGGFWRWKVKKVQKKVTEILTLKGWNVRNLPV